MNGNWYGASAGQWWGYRNTNSYAGWHVFPNTRRKTKKQVYAERANLGVDKRTIEQTAKKVVERSKVNRVVDITKIDDYYRNCIPDLTALFMAELRLTVKSPDYTRAIQAALAVKKLKEAQRLRDEEDEEEALLLFM